MGLGILAFIKNILKSVFGFFGALTLYIGWLGISLYSIYRDARLGLFFLIAMAPLPHFFYMLHRFPFGKDMVDILTFSILIGIVLQRYGFPKTQNRSLIIFFLIFTYFELWMASLRYSLPMPITRANYQLAEYKNYAEMILFYFLTVSLISQENDRKKLVVIMGVVFLVINLQCYRNFSAGDVFNWGKRVDGGFNVVGLGANHIGAFAADFGAFFLGMFLSDNNRKRRLLFLAGVLLGLHPLFFSYSRGAYAGALGVLVFFGLVKKRSLLVLAGVLVFSYAAILPTSVVDRIQMTETPEGELENSAGGRLDLWRLALDLFQQNPLTGVGFDGYALSVGGVEMSSGVRLHAHQDAHNFYARTAAEQGLAGIILLLALLFCSFLSGWRLFRMGNSQFQRSIGLGFTGCVIAFSITNIFGDRWSYYVLGSFFWVLFGMVDACLCGSEALAGEVESPGILKSADA